MRRKTVSVDPLLEPIDATHDTTAAATMEGRIAPAPIRSTDDRVLSALALVVALVAGALAITSQPISEATPTTLDRLPESSQCADGQFVTGWTADLEPTCAFPPLSPALTQAGEIAGCQLDQGELSDPGPCLAAYFEGSR